MNEPKISVILPVYNVEPYIEECIKSLKAQTMRELEFIFVDDCSPDASMEAVESWAAEDSRVRILRNDENLGAGPSRNRGIDAARGSYCGFVDPDDFVAPDFYELLYTQALASGADIVKGSRARVEPDGKTDTQTSTALNRAIESHEADGRPLFCVFKAEHQSAIYRTSLLNEAHIRYGSSHNAEDTTFLLNLCLQSQNISLEDAAAYFYRSGREGAATASHTYARSMNEIGAIADQFDLLFAEGSIEGSEDYSTRALLNFTSRYSLAQENEVPVGGEDAMIQQRFAEQLDRVPNRQALVASHPELEVLADYGYAIPMYKETPERFHQRRAERWAHYLAGHPSDFEEMQPQLSMAIFEYLLACRNDSPHETAPGDSDTYVDALLSPFALPQRRCIRKTILNQVQSRAEQCPSLDAFARGFAGDNPIRISAVIPVHNAGDYIHCLIASLKAQTLEELEFIFVDDASTDNSLEAVEAWAANDPRVRIIRNAENLGEGGSRNVGIRAAQGTYFCSLDPDDWVAPDFFELLYSEARRSKADTVKGTRVRIEEESGEELLPRSVLNDGIRGSLEVGKPLFCPFHYEHQSAIFRRMLFNGDTLYGVSSNACDTTFLLRICLYVESISFADAACYYYLARSGSATGSFGIGRSLAELTSLEEQIDTLKDEASLDSVYEYLGRRACCYNARFFQALSQKKISQADEDAYVSLLSAHLCRIPNIARFYESMPESKPIVEEGILLPASISFKGNSYKEEVNRWVTYLSRQSASGNQALAERYASIVSSLIERRIRGEERVLSVSFFVLIKSLKLGHTQRQTLLKHIREVLAKRALQSRNHTARRLKQVLRMWKARKPHAE